MGIKTGDLVVIERESPEWVDERSVPYMFRTRAHRKSIGLVGRARKVTKAGTVYVEIPNSPYTSGYGAYGMPYKAFVLRRIDVRAKRLLKIGNEVLPFLRGLEMNGLVNTGGLFS